MADHHPLPLWLSTFTGITVASGATPVIGVPKKLKPRIVLATCVPWVFWSFSHQSGGEGVAPLDAAPPPTNEVAYSVAIRSAGKYARHVGSRPESRIPMYTPLPVWLTLRVLTPGPRVTFTASRFHMLSPPVNALTPDTSGTSSATSPSGSADATYGSPRSASSCSPLPRRTTALISGRTSNTDPNAPSSLSMAAVGATDVRTLIAIARGGSAPPRASVGSFDGGVGPSEQAARATIAAMAISLGQAMNRIGS